MQDNQEDANKSKAQPKKRKKLFGVLFLVLIVAAILGISYWYLHARNYVSTDNAYVGAEVAQVTPSTGGTVKSIEVIDTQKVKVGDVLVVIDDVDAKLALAQTAAQLAQMQTNLDRAKIDFERRQALAQSGSVSGEELSTAENAYKAAQASYDATKARGDQAQIDLERTVIRAPIDGVIAKRSVQLGQRVQVGTPLLSVVPLDKVHVDANFKEVQLRKVKIGMPVELEADIYGDDVKYHGKVAGFSGGTGAAFAIIPAQNATGNWIKVVQRLPVRVELDPKELAEHPLQVGLSMEVTIDISGAH
ncbi:MAG: EmrA/EmrK family multidrug efflux transporter periplasmic adaptor subunit [Micavibrio aeruginosavorus]|uniref:EmrA/EmrK family multidrug efflux transporter periplasmic adaptor subunit n=1 Tax=Micavibrio aeruginosavorus TaxID=349221 RepID=A0A2W5FP43_9BACT|nr:MAG: EmrA/EmrK family multidrug efflux transporter periplasmic adaptor subunit [Micavibrio aeruginosavorus]